MPDVHLHLTDPSPETIAAAVAACEPPPKPAPIIGATVREVDGGAQLDLAPELRKALVDFGWLPPVDGE